MSRKLVLASAVSLALLPGMASALGLGGIRTQSALNEPFFAEIELIDAKPDELDSIKVLLAPPEEFERAGSPRPHFLTRLRFQPQVGPQGRTVIQVTSSEPIREPFIDFLVEVNWPQGRMVKGYTVLLDPPVTLDRRAPRVERPTATSRTAAGPARVPGAPGAGGSGVPPGYDTGAYPLRYGPVEGGAGLWRVARSLAPPGATVAQTAMALYRANQGAFIRGDINKLRADAVLEIPSAAELFALSASDAERQFGAALRGDRVTSTPLVQVAEAAPSEDRLRIATATQTPPLPRAEVLPPPVATAPPSVTPAPELGALQQELLLVQEAGESTRQETEELRTRIRELETQLADIQRLLQLRNEQLAMVQAAQREPAPASDVAATDAAPLPLSPEPTAVEAPEPVVTEESVPPVEGAELVAMPETPEAEAAEPAPVATTEPPPADAGQPVPVATTEPPPAEAGEPEGMATAEPPGAAVAEPAVVSVVETPAPPVAESEMVVAEGPKVAMQVEPAATVPPSGAEAAPEVSSGPTAASPTLREPPPAAGPDLAFLSAWAETLLASPMAVGGGVAALLALLTLVIIRRRRLLGEMPPAGALAGGGVLPDSGLSSADLRHPDSTAVKPTWADSRLAAGDSVLGPTEADHDEGDVVSEADVYIAYGRYREAQALLEDELRRAPTRIDLKLKLAEAYSGAKNLTALKSLMGDIERSGAHRLHPDQWARLEKALGGLETAPDAGPMAAKGTLDTDVAEPGRPGPQAGPLASLGAAPAPAKVSAGPSDLDLNLDDLDFGLGKTPAPAASGESATITTDLDLQREELDRFSEIDFGDSGVVETSSMRGAQRSASAPAAAPASDSFDLLLPLSQETTTADLASSQWQSDSGLWDEVATKLDLARAYIEMEDPDAARVILQEVVNEGNDGQRAEAREMLVRLG